MNYYTYIYYDPSRNNEPIYVGKGSKERAWKHLDRKDTHPFTSRLIHMKRNGVMPIIGIYGSLDEELALLVEEELIALYGRKDLNKGPLLNLTDGGIGGTCVVISEETKRKRSVSQLESWKNQDKKERHSVIQKKRYADPIKKQQHRDSLRHMDDTPDRRLKIAAAQREINTAEVRNAKSERMKIKHKCEWCCFEGNIGHIKKSHNEMCKFIKIAY